MEFLIKKWQLAVILASASAFLSAATVLQAAETDEDIWSDDQPQGQRQRRMSKERVDQLLDQLAEAHPERAEELRKLRKDNPEQFRKEIRNTFAERHRGPGQPAAERRGQGRGRGGQRQGSETRPGRMRGRGGPQEQGEGQGRRQRWRERMERKHDEYIEWLQKNFPEEAKRLARLHDKYPENPEEYIQQVIDSREKFGEIMEAQERNPELADILKEEYELKADRDELLEKINTAKGKKRKELVKKLEELVNIRFDLIVRKKHLRYEYLLRRLERLQKAVKEREAEVEQLKSKKSQLINKRIEELTGEAEEMDWD
ncbi:MAG: hypothetical protein ACYTFK_00620 [Planctomycetota bacterium]|jgi:hypothetical protein